MYSVLIVDDEKMIRDEVYDLLSMEEGLELDLMQADSAIKALEILLRQKIDIIIMDINMPVMSGLELYDKVREHWSFCKVIFLTGYSEFDYVYKVHKHARYLLKAEEDEKIVEAVRESIEEIKHDLLLEKAADSSENRKMDREVYERGLFFQNLFVDAYGEVQLTKELAEHYSIPFWAEDDVFYVILKHESIYHADYLQSRETIEELYTIIQRCFFNQMKGTFFELDRNYFVLMISPYKMADDVMVLSQLSGNADSFLKSAEMNTGVSFSVLIGAEKLKFKALIRRFTEIRDLMVWMQWGEIRVCGLDGEPQNSGALQEQDRQQIRQLAWKTAAAMEALDEEMTLQLLYEIEIVLQSVGSMHDLFALEMYCSISSKMLCLIKRLNINEKLAFQIGTMNLYNVSMHENWQDAFGYLIHVAKVVFDIKNSNEVCQTQETVEVIKQYILENLSGDTSLYVLSEHVHFSQEYILRIFKKSEGITILQYINDLKLARAKELLAESSLQMKEIAEILGFNSAGYFGRFFRSKTGKTPQKYREMTVAQKSE